MFRIFRWVIFLSIVAAIAVAGFNAEKLLDRYAPLDLREPPGMLMPVQLYFLRASPEKCFAVLARSEVQVTR